MKSLAFLFWLPLIGLVSSSPVDQIALGNPPSSLDDALLALDLSELDIVQLKQSYPGFHIDLTEKRFVEVEEESVMIMTEWDKIRLRAKGIKFFDITDYPTLHSCSRPLQSFTYPKEPNATDKVFPVLKTVQPKNMEENLQKFTSFRTRYYRSDSGKESQQWLLGRIAEITAAHASAQLKSLISFREFEHSWGQNSILLRIQGSSSDEDAVLVIGAHQDSTNLFPFLPAPGADDDGSGSITILEAYRALLDADFKPTKNVEFHWYSAEEGGLLGSQAVAQAYAGEGVNVIAMSQFDMTAWVKAGSEEVVGIITDYVNPDLTAFNKLLVETYLDIPYAETKCGYACSDHASWFKAGYPSIFTIESKFEDSNKHIHTTQDRIDISPEFSFEHMREFAKLAVAFAVELGGWE